MTLAGSALVASAARWLGTGALQGTLFAALVWLGSVTVFRRATGRTLALLWLLALIQFVLIHPFELRPLKLRSLAVQPEQLNGVPPGMGALASSAGTSWLCALYLASIAFLGLRLLVRQRRLRRRVAACAAATPSLLACVRVAARRLSLARVPDVRVTDAPIGPFSVGPARPTLVLPRWLCEPGARLDAVLLHELAHLARRDHWVMLFEHAVATLFFFWPPVRWVSRQLADARELACDERAIEQGGFSVTEYGTHLVGVVARARQELAFGGGLAISQGSFRLERRIDRLLLQAWAQRSSLGARCWQAAVLGLLATGSLYGVRLVVNPPPPRTTAIVPATARSTPPLSDEANISLDPSDRLGMSLPEPCLPQSCGTPCVP